MTMIRCLILQLLAVFVVVCSESQDNKKLYLLVLAPFPGGRDPPPIFARGHSIVPAVQLAVEHINNSTHILPNHTLDVIVGDSGCNYGTEVALPFVEQVVYEPKEVLGIVGPACTEASLFLANITQQNRYGIIQAIMATSNIFDDHTRYRHTFGMISSFQVLVEKFVSISQNQTWNEVGVLIDQSREFFLQTFHALENLAKKHMITLRTWSVFAPHYITAPMNELQSNNSIRVIFAIMSARTARHVACTAFHNRMAFPQYQFVYAGRSLANILVLDDESLSFGNIICDESMIRDGLNGSIMLQYGLDSIAPETELTGTTGLTVGEVKRQFAQRLKEYGDERNQTFSHTDFAYPYYDGIWALALSIHHAIDKVAAISSNNDFFVNGSYESEVIRQKFQDLSFQGISVDVSFNRTTGRVTNIVDVSQVNGSEEIPENIIHYIPGNFRKKYVHLHPVVVTLFFVLILALLSLNIVLHAINIHYRECFTVKASSPRLNHFIFVSCYLILLAATLETIHYGFLVERSKETSAKVLCNTNFFLHPICLSLIISTVFVKLWRLYSIFNRSFKRQLMIHDKHLAMVIVALQVCTILISIPGIAVEEARYEVIYQTSFETIDGEIVKSIETTCATREWLSSLPYLLVFIVAMMSFWLAYKNRKIRQNAYRSKDTIVFTYLFCCILGVVGLLVILGRLLDLSLYAIYLLSTFESLCVVLLCNVMLFVPPSYPIIKGKIATLKKPNISGGLKSVHFFI